jgi:hypothetical protein
VIPEVQERAEVVRDRRQAVGQGLKFAGVRHRGFGDGLIQGALFGIGEAVAFLATVALDLGAYLVRGDGPQSGAKAGAGGEIRDAAEGEDEVS